MALAPSHRPPPTAESTCPAGTNAQLQPADKPPPATKDPQSQRPENPGAGRTTPLGRKTERPASIKVSGPSGQRGRTQHQKLHTNK